MTTASERTGLLVRGETGTTAVVPLTRVRVRVAARGPLARVTVSQDYENREKVPVEAVYVFPLEEGSAVCGFTVVLDGKTIRGEVLPKDEAFDRYDDAMANGHGAFLLDQERPNIFTASVGNLMPGEAATIEISYITELAPEGNGVRLSLPATVSPRYHPEHRRDFEGMTDAERISPPISEGDTPYRLDLEVSADLLSPIRVVESPSHKIRTEITGTRVRAVLAGDEGALDRDFVLILEAEEPFRPAALMARDAEGDRYALVTFRPEFPLTEQRDPVEVVFLVDCSGSMDGSSMLEARRALALCLQSLVSGDRFNVVRFGSNHEALFGESMEYTEKTLSKGRDLAQSMIADLGGTEILSPLKEVLEARPVRDLPRRVVLLTDGQVSNEEEVIALAAKHRRRATIFAFGIGAGSSEHLVRGIARASGGAAEFVYPGETIDEKVLRHFARIAAAAADLSVKFDGLDVADVTPEHVPALAPGEFISFIAQVRGGTEGRAVLRGTIAGRPVSTEVAIREGPADPDADAIVPLLWARRRIRGLEEGETDRAGRGSRQAGRARSRVDAELVRLGTRFGLMSAATSYVAIEERAEDERATERAELRRIPVSLTKGWGGDAMMRPPMMGSHPTAMMSRTFRRASPPPSADIMLDACMSMPMDSIRESQVPRFEANESSASPSTGGIFFTQNADGSWDLTRDLAEECGADLLTLRAAAAALNTPDAEGIVATRLVLALAERLPDRKRKPLIPMLMKAERWLTRASAGIDEPADGWDAWVTSLMP